MKLSARQRCPIHHRTDCCGRKKEAPTFARRFASFEPGVRRIPDEHHPRGYRELRSKSAMRRLMVKKVEEQSGCCYLCGKEFTDMTEVTPEHKEPRGMGAARRDDHPENMGAACGTCNSEKGSKRL